MLCVAGVAGTQQWYRAVVVLSWGGGPSGGISDIAARTLLCCCEVLPEAASVALCSPSGAGILRGLLLQQVRNLCQAAFRRSHTHAEIRDPCKAGEPRR